MVEILVRQISPVDRIDFNKNAHNVEPEPHSLTVATPPITVHHRFNSICTNFYFMSPVLASNGVLGALSRL